MLWRSTPTGGVSSQASSWSRCTRSALALVLVMAAPMAPALGADIFVTTTEDGIAANGDCTLREAIRAANTNAAVDDCAAGGFWPVDVIVLTEAVEPYRLTVAGLDDSSGDLDVYSRLDIAGAPSTIDAAGLGDRIFDLRAGAVVKLLMVDLRGGDAGGFPGGAAYVSGGSSLLVFGSSIRGNRGAFGAGIAADGSSSVVLHDSDVSNNAAAHGIAVNSSMLQLVDSTVADNDGAGVTAFASTVIIRASTISGNTKTGLHAAGSSSATVRNATLSDNGRGTLQRGGGLYVESPAVASLYYSTVAGNAAMVGGGIAITGTLTLKGTILGANQAPSAPDCWSEGATITSQGWNVIHRDHCELVPIASDRVGSDPKLDVLADLGGPTRTRRLLPGSPALDHGDPSDFPLFDQRAEGRPRHGDADTLARADIGAHENGNTLVVDTAFDPAGADGKCGLRDAIRAANTDTAVDGCRAGFDRDLIWINNPASIILALSGADASAALGDLDVLEDVDVSGVPGVSAKLDGGPLERVFEVHAPARLHLAHLEVARSFDFLAVGGGLRVGPSAFANLFDVEIRDHTAAGARGGGALVEGELVGEKVWVHDNASNVAGGGIALDGDGARLVLRHSRITGNASTSGDGGGIAILGGSASLLDTTVADNLATGDGGGIYNEDSVDLANVTLAHNRANSDGIGGGAGGGIDAQAGTTRLWNTLVAENLATSSPDCAGTLVSLGYNLIASATCAIDGGVSDLLDVEAGLASVGLSPATAGTYATVSDSPARDAGRPDLTGSLLQSCGRRDEVGVARPIDGDGSGTARCDIGAIESIGIGPLDADGDGFHRPLTDGMLILRFLAGLTGDLLVAGAVADGAPRSSAESVTDHLSGVEHLLDVDGNGSPGALTDGILVFRYLFEITGGALIDGALGSGAVRTTPAAIVDYLDLLAY